MPIQNFHEDFLGFKIDACNVERGLTYIMRFDGCKREFIPYSDIAGEQTLDWDCTTGDLSITESGPLSPFANTVNLSLLLIDPIVLAIILSPASWNNGSYIGPATPTACIGQFYYDDVTGTRYQYNGTTRYQFDTLPLNIRTLVTYAELEILQTGSILIPGMNYQITDFQNISPVGNAGGEVTTGPIEQLWVVADSQTTISTQARSLTNKDDIIRYDFTDNAINSDGYVYMEFNYEEGDFTQNITSANVIEITMPGPFIPDGNFYFEGEDDNSVSFSYNYSDLGTALTYVDLGSNVIEFTMVGYTGDISNIYAGPNENGYLELNSSYTVIERPGIITYRKDPVQNIETNFDFMTVKSRFWEFDVPSIEWAIGTAYIVGNIIHYSGVFYKCISANTGQTPNSSNERLQVFNYPVGGYVCASSYGFNFDGTYVLCTTNYQDIPVFSTNTYTYDDEYILNYKNITRNNNYCVACSSNSNGPTMRGVDLGTSSSNIFFSTGTIEDVKIGSGSNTMFQQNATRIEISKTSYDVLYSCTDIRCSYMNNSSMYACQKITGSQLIRFVIAYFYNFTGIHSYRTTIGNRYATSKDAEVEYSNNNLVTRMENVDIVGYFYNNIMGVMRNVTIIGRCHNNTRNPGGSIGGRFGGFVWNNTIDGIINGTFESFSSNDIVGNISTVTVSGAFSDNFLQCNQFTNNYFNTFSSNGNSAVDRYRGDVQNNNIHTFYGNHSTGGQVSANVGSIYRFNDFGITSCIFRDNQITNVESLTMNGVCVFENNIMSEVSTLSLAGDFQYNNGSRLQGMTLGDFIKNTFNLIQGLNLTTATIVADNSRSKTIHENDDTGYSISWFNSITGLNFDNITT